MRIRIRVSVKVSVRVVRIWVRDGVAYRAPVRCRRPNRLLTPEVEWGGWRKDKRGSARGEDTKSGGLKKMMARVVNGVSEEKEEEQKRDYIKN